MRPSRLKGESGNFITTGCALVSGTPTRHGFANEAGEIRVLGKLNEKGFVFKGLSRSNWCFDCGSLGPAG